MGIEKGNIERIFSYGFTTKTGGHGFGLHGAALAASEMGGALTAKSDGIGHGSCFELSLPKNPLKVNDGRQVWTTKS